MHVVRYPWKLWLNHVIFVGLGRACPGMLNVLQINYQYLWESLTILFVACSYTSRKATLSWYVLFSWVCPKVSEITNHQYLWKVLSDFVNFLHVVICILLDIHWSYQNLLFWAGIVRHRLLANQIVRWSKLKKLKTTRVIKLIFCFHWSYKKYHAILSVSYYFIEKRLCSTLE